MKRTIASILFLSVALPALGTRYRGSITQTVTSTNTPIYYIGETFLGFYQYDSHGPDGTFYILPEYPSGRPPGANESLTGEVYLTYFEELDDGFTGGYFIPLEATEMRQAYLTVSGGGVTDFHWQWGASPANFDISGFDTWNFQDFETSGSLSFGAPTRVPDSTLTIWPLAAALCACFWRYAWVKKHLHSSLVRPLS